MWGRGEGRRCDLCACIRAMESRQVRLGVVLPCTIRISRLSVRRRRAQRTTEAVHMRYDIAGETRHSARTRRGHTHGDLAGIAEPTVHEGNAVMHRLFVTPAKRARCVMSEGNARGERSNAPSLRNTCQARALCNERAESPPLASAGHHQTQARAAHQLQKACFQFLSSNLGLVTAWHSSALIPWRACDRRSDAQHRQHTQPPSAGSHGQAAHADSTSGAALRVGHGPSSLGSCIAHLISSSSASCHEPWYNKCHLYYTP